MKGFPSQNVALRKTDIIADRLRPLAKSEASELIQADVSELSLAILSPTRNQKSSAEIKAGHYQASANTIGS